MTAASDLLVRDFLSERDLEGIAELHRRVYRVEYGRNEAFVRAIRDDVRSWRDRGWPELDGAVRLVELGGEIAGSAALTDEGGGIGRVRWVALAAELRGRGLGRRMVGELVSEAREAGIHVLRLETFSELTSAARIYRELGFEVVAAHQRTDWGSPILYQHYELRL